MVKFRDLDKVRFLIKEGTGLDVGYAYDDLVFSEHGLFIVRFNDEDEKTLFCYFNKDLISSKQKELQTELVDISTLNGLKMLYKGKFEMEQLDGATEFELKLYEN
jgi:hypothetical protein